MGMSERMKSHPSIPFPVFWMVHIHIRLVRLPNPAGETSNVSTTCTAILQFSVSHTLLSECLISGLN